MFFFDAFAFLLTLLSDSEDNEDIKVHRKPRRNAIKDSDSEEEEGAVKASVTTEEAAVPSESSGEETEKLGRAAQKSRRTSHGPSDGEESGPEQLRGDSEEPETGASPLRKREKSRRHREKKEKRSRAVEKLKKKQRISEKDQVSQVSAAISGPALG